MSETVYILNGARTPYMRAGTDFKDVSAADLPVVETGSPDDAASRHSSSGGCAAGGSPVAGCLLPLLLMLAGLVLRRHARAA